MTPLARQSSSLQIDNGTEEEPQAASKKYKRIVGVRDAVAVAVAASGSAAASSPMNPHGTYLRSSSGIGCCLRGGGAVAAGMMPRFFRSFIWRLPS